MLIRSLTRILIYYRRQNFLSWVTDLEERLDRFSQNVNHPDVVLRRLENEFCTEVDSKHGEYDWLINTGECLAKYEENPEGDTMRDKIDSMTGAWKKVNDDTKGEVEKVKHIIKVSITSLVG